jgi:hypothetical protein
VKLYQGAIMQTLRHSSLGTIRRPRRIAELIACGAAFVGWLVGSAIIGAWLYAAFVPETPGAAKIQSTTNYSAILKKGDRLDRANHTRDWTAGPTKRMISTPDQKLLIGCEPAFSKIATSDRRAARCLT